MDDMEIYIHGARERILYIRIMLETMCIQVDERLRPMIITYEDHRDSASMVVSWEQVYG
jgi:hypothetical protein